MGDLAPVLAVTGLAAIFTWLVRSILLHRRHQQTTKLQAELQTKLLERFGTADEMVAYLQSDAGRHFVRSATIERGNPFGRILGSVQVGLILVVTGLGFTYLRYHVGIPRDSEGFLFIGTMALALGIGFLLSAAAAYLLSRAWGLLAPRSEGAEGG